MLRSRLVVVILIVSSLSANAGGVAAQTPSLSAGFRGARLSEPATVAQTVENATITIKYSRPVARGRSQLFGPQVHWGETWTPGADWATTIEVDEDVQLNGQRVPTGTYSVWMIPQQNQDWTVILHRDAERFHTQRPTRDGELLRLTVRPEQGPRTEVLTWSFPSIGRAGTSLRMQWGTILIPLRIAVQPTNPPTVTSTERGTYLGRYEGDSGQVVEITDQAGVLHLRATPALPGLRSEIELIPDVRGQFHPGVYRDGRLLDIETELTLVFQTQAGRATSFELVSLDATTLARAARAQ